MRCESCSKFAALNFEEPEVTDELTIDEDGNVSGTVRIYRTSECCGDEMKEAELEMHAEVDLYDDEFKEHFTEEIKDGVKYQRLKMGCELYLDCDDPEQVEEGGGRYKKSYFGASITFNVHCRCQPKGADPLYSDTIEEKVAASEMEEMY